MTKKRSLAPNTIPSRSVPLRCMSDGAGKPTENPGLHDPLLETSKRWPPLFKLRAGPCGLSVRLSGGGNYRDISESDPFLSPAPSGSLRMLLNLVCAWGGGMFWCQSWW